MSPPIPTPVLHPGLPGVAPLHLPPELAMFEVVVEHSEQVMAAAHWTIELGPGAAEDGGTLLFEGIKN